MKKLSQTQHVLIFNLAVGCSDTVRYSNRRKDVDTFEAQYRDCFFDVQMWGQNNHYRDLYERTDQYRVLCCPSYQRDTATEEDVRAGGYYCVAAAASVGNDTRTSSHRHHARQVILLNQRQALLVVVVVVIVAKAVVAAVIVVVIAEVEQW